MQAITDVLNEYYPDYTTCYLPPDLLKLALSYIIYTEIKYLRNGHPAYTCEYVNGKKHGVCKSWYKNKQLRMNHNYDNGEKEGDSKEWYKNGQLKFEDWYLNGKKYGMSKQWYQSGQLKSETSYYNGMLSGMSREWYEDGRLKRERRYDQGKRIFNGAYVGCRRRG